MVENNMEFRGSFSRQGTPCLGVGGGAFSNTFVGRMVLRPDGSKPHALFIRRHGDLACALDQATVPMQLGDRIITFSGSLPAQSDNPEMEVMVYIVTSISDKEGVPIFVCRDAEEDYLGGVPGWNSIPWEALDTFHNRDGRPFVA